MRVRNLRRYDVMKVNLAFSDCVRSAYLRSRVSLVVPITFVDSRRRVEENRGSWLCRGGGNLVGTWRNRANFRSRRV